MASSHSAAAEDSKQAATAHLTLGWFAKRSALWLLTVSAGIGAACFLYAFSADSDELAGGKPAPVPTQSIAKAH